MAQNLVSVLSSGSNLVGNQTLSTLFGENVLSETAAKYGITLEEGETWDDWGSQEKNQTAYGNLLVLTAADEMEKKKNDPSYEMSTASDMILEFSSYYGFAASNPEFSREFDTYMAQLNDGTVTDVSSGANWYRNLENAANNYGFNTDYNNGDQKEMDNYAFLSIMAGLGNPTEEQAAQIAADINNNNLFTNGVVNNMYNNYLDAVDIMVAPALSGGDMLQLDYAPGEVLIFLNTPKGEIRTSNSLPDT